MLLAEWFSSFPTSLFFFFLFFFTFFSLDSRTIRNRIVRCFPVIPPPVLPHGSLKGEREKEEKKASWQEISITFSGVCVDVCRTAHGTGYA